MLSVDRNANSGNELRRNRSFNYVLLPKHCRELTEVRFLERTRTLYGDAMSVCRKIRKSRKLPNNFREACNISMLPNDGKKPLAKLRLLRGMLSSGSCECFRICDS